MGYTLRKINDEIGSNFRNNLYAGCGMNIVRIRNARGISADSLAEKNNLSKNRMFRIPKYKLIVHG